MRASRYAQLFGIAMIVALPAPAPAQDIAPAEITLDNGMTFLLLPRDGQPLSIAAGWVAKVGSVNERPGITGMSHFFEHMMFKGTTTIGTTDAALDAEFLARQETLKTRIDEEVRTTQFARARRGEIPDPWDPAFDSPLLRTLRGELDEIIAEHEAVIVDNEYDKIYAAAGASGINAFTTNDFTFYFVTVPSNKLELWAWMESDRLMDSVFREFYAERDVVHEERRLSTESTPTGIFQEQFDAMFWQSSPYGWPVIGWPSDLNSYTLEAAREFFDVYYQPSNLVGVIVGDFSLTEATTLIERYFGRLEAGTKPVPPVVTREMPQLAETRMRATCDCQSAVEVRYHTVPFGHMDSYPLEMMAAVLNGRSGRLYPSLVENQSLASTASASAGGLGEPAKYDGFFSFQAEVMRDNTPTVLERAWYAELKRLQDEPVPRRELQKVRNQVITDAVRGMKDNSTLMLRLGYYAALGDWRHINDTPARLKAVTPADLQRVARQYFAPQNRSVAIYRRTGDAVAPAADDALLALAPGDRARAQAMVAQLQNYSIESLRRAREALPLEPPGGGPELQETYQAFRRYILLKIDERIASLEALENNP